jgi:AraC-like DNA-binding protein
MSPGYDAAICHPFRVVGGSAFVRIGSMKSVQLTLSGNLLPFATFLGNIGEPVPRLLRQAGLPSTCLDDRKTPVPTASIWRFRELAARRTGLPNLTSVVMDQYELADLGPLARTVLRAPTLLKMIQEFRRLVYTESTTATLDITPCGDHGMYFSNRLALRHEQGEWHAELYVLLWMLKLVWLVDPDWSPEVVWCTAAATVDRERTIESYRARPHFGQRCTGFVIPRSMLALPRRGAGSDSRTRDVDEADLWSIAPSASASDAIRQVIRAYATDGWLSAAHASDLVGMSLRTMQRSLSTEGRTYSDLLDETRSETAADLLENTDAPMAEISDQLGYSDQSGFTRAFRRWAAVSPREFRTQRRAARTS